MILAKVLSVQPYNVEQLAFVELLIFFLTLSALLIVLSAVLRIK